MNKIMINVDGTLASGAEAVVPVLDRGFLYGDSVYEVFRTYRGVGFMLDTHFERLQHSADLISLHIGQQRDFLLAEIRRTIVAGNLSGADSDDDGARDSDGLYVRLIITRGWGPINLRPAEKAVSRYVIIVQALPQWPAHFYRDGIRLAVPLVRRNAVDALNPNIKGGNYLNNILGMMEAVKRGADDCLMLNHEGCVAESSTSNVWFVINNVMCSPAPVHGNLRGLTREALLAALQQQNISCDSRPLGVAALHNASECFITSATREVMPVRSLLLEDGAMLEFPLGGGVHTRRAIVALHNYIDNYVAAHPQHALC